MQIQTFLNDWENYKRVLDKIIGGDSDETTRKDFIDGLRREGYSIPLDDLKDLIEYYEELLDEQEIGKDDYVPDEYDYKKIIREFKLSGAYKEVKTEKKNSVKKSLSLIILSIVCMPILLVY